jgi:hypothetical protein
LSTQGFSYENFMHTNNTFFKVSPTGEDLEGAKLNQFIPNQLTNISSGHLQILIILAKLAVFQAKYPATLSAKSNIFLNQPAHVNAAIPVL